MTRSGPADDPLAGDPGLQRQRTALAWWRTGLAGLAVAVVSALAWIRLDLTPLAAGAVALLAAAGAVTLGRQRARRTSREVWSAMVLTTAAVVVLGLLGAAAAGTALLR